MIAFANMSRVVDLMMSAIPECHGEIEIRTAHFIARNSRMPRESSRKVK